MKPKPHILALLSAVIVIIMFIPDIMAEETLKNRDTTKPEHNIEVQTLRKIKRLISKNDLTTAAVEANNYLKKSNSDEIAAISAGLTLISGMKSGATERLEKLNDNLEAISLPTARILLPISLHLGQLEESLTINTVIRNKIDASFVSSQFFYIKVASLSLSTHYFLFFLTILILVHYATLKICGTDISFLAIPAAAGVFTVIWLIYQSVFSFSLLKMALGIKSADMLVRMPFSHLTMGIFNFLILYTIAFPLIKKVTAKHRSISAKEANFSVLLGIGFQSVSCSLPVLGHTVMLTPLTIAGMAIIVLSGFLLYLEVKKSVALAEESNTILAQKEADSSGTAPQAQELSRPAPVTELQISETIRQHIKDENYQEANKTAQSFYLLKKGEVRPEFIMRMIELKLEIDKVSEAKELLGKLENIRGIEAKKQQLCLAIAYTKVFNGELSQYAKSAEGARAGEAILGQNDLFILEFCQGLFHFQRKEFTEAVRSFDRALEKARTAAEKMKIKFWTAFSMFEARKVAEIEKIAAECKKIMGLEISQCNKQLVEALLMAANNKMPECIKLCKNALTFNEHSAVAAFLLCRFLIDEKKFSDAQSAAMSIDKEHFLSHRALELTV